LGRCFEGKTGLMKISDMLKREDFYSINQRTLESYFNGASRTVELFVYPRLNVIIEKRPAKPVKKYVYTEYRVKGSAVRRLLVFLYTRLAMNSGGLAAARKFSVVCDGFSGSMMVYPCNKRYRIFDFNAGTVDVIAKDGFPYAPVSRELCFRKEHRLPFVLPILKELGTGYREKIIDGLPLARLDGANYEQKRNEAWELWSEYTGRTLKTEKLGGYADALIERIKTDVRRLHEEKPGVNVELLLKAAGYRLSRLAQYSEELVPVCMSHGDFHPGNIWVENGTGRIYIIDWESVGNRSVWYDRAAMFGGLRNPGGAGRIAKAGERQFCQLLGTAVPNWSRHVVIIEELMFRMDELFDFPTEISSDSFNRFLIVMQQPEGDAK